MDFLCEGANGIELVQADNTTKWTDCMQGSIRQEGYPSTGFSQVVVNGNKGN